MQQLEIELKFYIVEFEKIRQRIEKLGGRSSGRVFETNYRYEDRDKTLLGNQSLLRLRKTCRKTILTFKSVPSEADSDFKIMNETEVEVDNAEAMDRILTALDFHREQTYEKWRETFQVEETQICLDRLPYGNFLELEGPKDHIRQLSAALDLSWEKRITAGYLAIFDCLKIEKRLPFADLTFDNFKNTPSEFGDIIRQFEKIPA